MHNCTKGQWKPRVVVVANFGVIEKVSYILTHTEKEENSIKILSILKKIFNILKKIYIVF